MSTVPGETRRHVPSILELNVLRYVISGHLQDTSLEK